MMERIPSGNHTTMLDALESKGRKATLITEREAAGRFNCSVSTIREWTRAGVLPAPIHLAGNKTYYCLEEITNKFANGGSHEKANRDGGI